MTDLDKIISDISNNEEFEYSELFKFLTSENNEERASILARFSKAFYNRKGRHLDQAEIFAKRAYSISNDKIYYSNQLVDILIEQQKVEDVKQIYKRVGLEYLKIHQIKEALFYFDKWLYAYPDILKIDKYEYDLDILDAINAYVANKGFESNSMSHCLDSKLKIGFLVKGITESNSVLIKINYLIAKYLDKMIFKLSFFFPETESEILNSKQGKSLLESFHKLDVKCFYAEDISDYEKQLFSVVEKIKSERIILLVMSDSLGTFSHYFISSFKPAPIMLGLLQGPPPQFISSLLDWAISWSYHPLIDSPVPTKYVKLQMELPNKNDIVLRTKQFFGLPEKSQIILSGGRYVKFQDIQYVESLLNILIKDSNRYLVIIGPSIEQIPFIVNLAEEEILNRVRIFPWMENYLELARHADVMIDTYPSGGGVLPFDIASLGIPIISFQNDYLNEFDQTQWSPLQEFISNDELTLKRGDYKSITELADRLLGDDEMKTRLGNKCKEEIYEKVSHPEVTVRKCEEVFFKLIQDRLGSEYIPYSEKENNMISEDSRSKNIEPSVKPIFSAGVSANNQDNYLAKTGVSEPAPSEDNGNLEYWKEMQNDEYFEKHDWYGKKYGGLKLFGDDMGIINNYTNLSKSMNTVVIGCGYGRESVNIGPHVNHIYGIDVSETILNKAVEFTKQNGVYNFTPVLADNWEESIPENIDFVYTFVVFQHLSKSLVRNYISGLRKKLNAGGRFLCQFCESDYGSEDAELKVYEPNVKWTRQEIIDLIRENNLNEITIQTTQVTESARFHWALFEKAENGENTESDLSKKFDRHSLKPLFSIIVPSYNQADYLPAALDSILAQTFTDWETIIVNDGSTDNTKSVMEEYTRKDSRFKLYHKDNGGVATALNIGIKQSKGEWICWLSSDDLFEPDKLEIHYKAIREHQNIKFFCTHWYILMHETQQKIAPGLWLPVPPKEFQVTRFFWANYIHGNSIAIHKTVFDKVGLFDETLRQGQDFDMWLRISACYESHFIDKRTCVTRIHPDQTTNSFLEGGVLDSTRALFKYLDNNSFEALFPFFDFNNTNDIMLALGEVFFVSTKIDAFLYRCGYTKALVERTLEWVSNKLELNIRNQVYEIIERVVNEHLKDKKPEGLVQVLKSFLNKDNVHYKELDFINVVVDYIKLNIDEGLQQKTIALEKYLEKLLSQNAVEYHNIKYNPVLLGFPKVNEYSPIKSTNIINWGVEPVGMHSNCIRQKIILKCDSCGSDISIQFEYEMNEEHSEYKFICTHCKKGFLFDDKDFDINFMEFHNNSVIHEPKHITTRNIAYLIPDMSSIGGGTKIALKHIQWLFNLGYDVTSYSYSVKPDWLDTNIHFIQIKDATELDERTSDLFIISSIFDIPKILNKIPIHKVVLLCQGYEGYHFGSDFIKLRSDKHILTKLHSIPVKVITVSKHLVELFKTKFNREVEYIPNCIDHNVFTYSGYTPDREKSILFIGNPFHTLKGFPFIAGALKIIQDSQVKISSLKLYIVMGFEFDNHETIRMNLERDIGCRVEFLFKLSSFEIGALMKRVSIVVCTSWYEGFSLPLIEAMACGTPVITTNNMGAESFCKNKTNSFVVRFGDNIGLAQGIIDILYNRFDMSLILQNAYQTSLEYSELNSEKAHKIAFKHLIASSIKQFDIDSNSDAYSSKNIYSTRNTFTRTIDNDKEDNSIQLKVKSDVFEIKKYSERILFVVHNFPMNWAGGTELYTYNLALDLINSGKDVHVLFPSPDSYTNRTIITESNYNGIKIFEVKYKHNCYSKEEFSSLFEELIVKEQYDVVHFHHTKGLHQEIFDIPIKLKIKSVLTIHDFHLVCTRLHLYIPDTNLVCTGPETPQKCVECLISDAPDTEKYKLITKELSNQLSHLKSIFPYFDLVTAPSRYVKNVFESNNLLNKNFIIKELGIKKIVSQRVKREGKDLVFGFVGALHKLKNIELLLNVFESITSDNVKLEIWGNGHPITIEGLKQRTADSKNIQYFRDYSYEEIGDILSRFDVLIVPSFNESYCLTVREALSVNLPVIASSRGGIPEVVIDNVNGILFDPSNKIELVNIINKIIDEPDILGRLRKSEIEIRDLKKDIDDWADIYSNLIKSNLEYKPRLLEEIDFSIIIPVHNKWQFTKACIESIESTNGNNKLEIIIIDNASNDNTGEYLKSLGRDIKVISHTTNETYAKSNNEGAKISKGKYLVFLNNDTQVLSGWLEAIKIEFDNNPSTGIQGAKLLYQNGKIQHAGMVFGSRPGRDAEPYHAYLMADPNASFVNKRREVHFVTGALLSIRKDDFNKAGGFDEQYNFGWEDTDLCMKVSTLGKRIIYNPLISAFHFESATKLLRQSIGDDMVSDNTPKEKRNREIFFNKWSSMLTDNSYEFYAEDGLKIQENSIIPMNDNELALYASKREEMKSIHSNYISSFAKYFWQTNYDSISSLLIIPTSAVGDNLMLTALVAALKAQFPHLSIYIKRNRMADLIFKGHGGIAGYVTSEDESKFDKTIDFNNIIAKLPEYYNGIAFMDILGNLAGFKFVKRDIVYQISDIERGRAKKALKNFDGHEIVGVHFSTSKDVKRSYPHGRELLKILEHKNPNLRFVHFGNESIGKLNDSYVFDCAENSVDLRSQIAIAEQCSKFITIDSAFFHIGHNLFRKPTLAILGLTNPALIGYHEASFAYINHELMNCLNCYWQRQCKIECMNDLLPTVIAEAFMDIKNRIKYSPEQQVFEVNVAADFYADKFIFEHYASRRDGTKLVLNDYDDLLPDYSKYWNGIAIKKSKVNKTEMNNYNSPADYQEESYFEALSDRKIKVGSDRTQAESLKLNLGCGDTIEAGFINIDLYSEGPDIVNMDARSLEYDDSSVDTILAADLLQCFSHNEIGDVLTEWVRVLKPEGKLIISCTSMKQISRLLLNGLINSEIASKLLFGNQEDNAHIYFSAFDEDFLTKELVSAGFTIESYDESNEAESLEDINISIVVGAVKSKNHSMPELTNENSTANQVSNLSFNFGDSNEDIKNVKAEETFDNSLLSGLSFNFDNKGEEAEYEVMEPEQEFDNQDYFEALSDRKPVVMQSPTISKDGPQINIVWEGSQFVWHSLALINREICYNIIKSGVAEVTIVPYEPDTFLPEGNPKYEILKQHDIRYKLEADSRTKQLPYSWIRHQWPPKAEEPKGSKWFIIQPWEFSTLRTDFVSIFQNADEVWTPSNYSRNSFINSGIEFDHAQVIPNGCDPELWSPMGKRFKFNTDKKLKFLFVGGTIYRKGIDTLLQAYVRSFTGSDNVSLIIKDMGGDSFYAGQTAKDQIDIIQKSENAPEIIYIDDYFTEEQMVELYKACDVFVCPYRGEGFSLPTLEAMASGLPVIVTKGGSTDDFVDESIGWLISSEKKSIGREIGGLPLTGEAYLLEPNQDELVETLKNIYGDPSQIFSKGLLASLRARTEWTWKKATVKLLSRLDLHNGTTMAKTAEVNLVDYTDDAIVLGEIEKKIIAKDSETAYDELKRLLRNTKLTGRMLHHAYCRMAELCVNLMKLDEVDQYLQKAGEIYHSVDELYLEANKHFAEEKYSDALDSATIAMQSWKDDKYDSTIGINIQELLSFTADSLLNDEDPNGALQIYLEVLKLNNNNANAYFGAGVCHLEIGSRDDARRMFEWALRINPDYEMAKKLIEGLKITQ